MGTDVGNDVGTGVGTVVGSLPQATMSKTSNDRQRINIDFTRMLTIIASDTLRSSSSWARAGPEKHLPAQDGHLYRKVFFALITTEGLDDSSRTRIQREAHAMSRTAIFLTIFGADV